MPNIVKNTSFPSLLDLLAPHSCRGCGRIGSVFCDCCKNHIIASHKHVCPNCKQEISVGDYMKETLGPAENTTSLHLLGTCPNCTHLPPIYTISSRDTVLGELIHDYKYHSIRALARTFAELLDATLPQELGVATTLVPLPTATHHVRSRGFDHTKLIAKHLARLRGYDVSNILLRAKNTVQVGTDREARLTQASSAYMMNPKAQIRSSATYLLLDDIWTTGASMRAAENILRDAGAEDVRMCLLAYSI